MHRWSSWKAKSVSAMRDHDHLFEHRIISFPDGRNIPSMFVCAMCETLNRIRDEDDESSCKLNGQNDDARLHVPAERKMMNLPDLT